jgi:signal transduction histidine kinase
MFVWHGGSRRVEEKTAGRVLVVYRASAFIVAISQILLVGYPRLFSWPDWILLSLIGAYSLFRLAHPFYHYERKLATAADFAGDLIICLALPALTGGLRSPFLLYALCPVLTVALFFPKKLTFIIASLPTLSVILSQILIYSPSLAMSFYPLELSFCLLGAYIAGSFLLALLPYVMNINAYQEIRLGATIDERSRLSREIHDGVAQILGLMGWKVELLRQRVAAGNRETVVNDVTEIQGLVEKAQQEMRQAINDLRASAGSTQGFVATLAQYATEFTQSYGIRCELRVADGQVTLPLPAELELLRIAREALTNVRRHSAADMVEVIFESKKDVIEMTIRDDGRGFDTQAVFQGHGLAVMEERAKSIGGELAIATSPGRGTEVKVSLPLPQSPPAAIRRPIRQALPWLGRR